MNERSRLFSAAAVVLGCGNTLFGDDGFGPTVAEALATHALCPAHACVVDAGTAAADLLFDLVLSPQKPKALFIVDAVQMSGRNPGELFWLALEDIPAAKRADFLMHQFPSADLLRELAQEGGVKVAVLAVQAGWIPNHVAPGLSESVARAVPHAVEILLKALASERPAVA
ncbi:hydrogenase maturation protease [Desulfosoma caldarium]|uniref:Coenzyme F420 hydrogenase subunit delta n=1 Tax=Desulfosoma caldarium TaxID=610254 RepID=A0A3N1VFQ5_9BACT|nr:hydrogenase maturation protease [Desulfosoma caldarium]ROR01686.1 coenzyme F420 hydrogenase subunit delta [Desulfosoma caldarium]